MSTDISQQVTLYDGVKTLEIKYKHYYLSIFAALLQIFINVKEIPTMNKQNTEIINFFQS